MTCTYPPDQVQDLTQSNPGGCKTKEGHWSCVPYFEMSHKVHPVGIQDHVTSAAGDSGSGKGDVIEVWELVKFKRVRQ